MKKEIEIGCQIDNEGKEIPGTGKVLVFEATAMTNHMIDTIFGGNFEQQIMSYKSGEGFSIATILHAAFVMNKRAELGKWRAVEALTVDDFYDWSDEIDSFGIEDKAEQIFELYMGNMKTKVFPKKEESQQPE